MKTFGLEKPTRTSQLYAAALIAVAALGAGCGKQAFVVTTSAAQQKAPGTFSVPPKVDILVVQDDTGSSMPIFSNISSQLNAFVESLQGQGWDYHMATIPLTTNRRVNQVQASQYDPNWGSLWLTPYPGATMADIVGVVPSAFRFPNEYTEFLTGADTSTASGAIENGFTNINAIRVDGSLTDTGFLRQDALLAIVLLSTGDDTSGRNICSGPYGSNEASKATAPCDQIAEAKNLTHPSIPCGAPGANPSPYCNNYESSLLAQKSGLEAFKGPNAPTQLRLYPIVSTSSQRRLNGSCMGANAYSGARYVDMGNRLLGKSFDICTTPIPQALTGVAANLATLELSFYTHFLFMAQQPDPETIVVKRHIGGDAGNTVTVPRDDSGLNGWRFVGEIANVPTTSIGSPLAAPTLNRGSGWAVQLFGSEILSGSDTATVEFLPAGAQNSGAQ